MIARHPQALGTLSFNVGDVTVTLSCRDAGLTMDVQGAAQGFLVTDRPADSEVRVGWAGLRASATGDQIFDSGGLWRLYRDGPDLVFRFASPVFGPIPYKEARLNPDFSGGEILFHRPHFKPGAPVYPLEYPLDELLMMHLLAQGRGVEVHACGVQDSDGRGYLFPGQSGAGKTTMARLWAKAGDGLVLSDDRIILRFLDGRLWMYGTPWHGEAELSCPTRTPLTQVFFLRKGTQNEATALRPAVAVARLMACCFVPFYNAAGLDFTLSFFEQVTKDVPCEELTFVPDGRAVDFVRRGEQRNA